MKTSTCTVINYYNSLVLLLQILTYSIDRILYLHLFCTHVYYLTTSLLLKTRLPAVSQSYRLFYEWHVLDTLGAR